MINIAVVGATGLVGQTFLKVLEEKNFDIKNLYLFASNKSAGKVLKFKNKNYVVEELNEKNIFKKKIDYALFSAGGAVSKNFAPVFKKYGAVVIDNSSAFRMEKDVPLVVPEVNPHSAFLHDGIIANPNCSTIMCMLPLKALDNIFRLRKVIYSTYQAVSGSGMKGLTDLKRNKQGKSSLFYPHEIYNNCLPQIDDFLDNGYTKEEMKMVNESRKILELPNLQVSATCVRVPVENCHSVEIYAEFKKEVNLEQAILCLKNFKNIVLLDNPKKSIYPLCTLANGKDEVFVGRIRKDLSNPNAIHMFCVADNIRKGAASNAVQIMELLIDKNI